LSRSGSGSEGKLDYIGRKQGAGFFPGFVSDPL
jgi:hypothetical protein